eukprot:m.179189 g.179189  ORF g.179189 m.179189 type:complete len:298 (-) comp18386_c0_seq2:664-1557(-)
MADLTSPGNESIAVLTQAIRPLFADAADSAVREASLEKYLGNPVAFKSTAELLASVGLVAVDATGAVTAVSQASSGSTNDDTEAGARCTDPLEDIKVAVLASLKTALKKQENQVLVEAEARNGPPKVGTQCVRNNCSNTYENEESTTKGCRYCPGEPVFHEGYKYWSCCDKRKTFDFEEFLAFPGCEQTDSCKWFKDETDVVEQKQCRFDWFQTPGDVVVSIFAKCIDPDQTTIQANANTLKVKFVYERTSTFELDLHLGGNVVVDKSSATLMSTKVDIKLKKADGGHWSGLEFNKE